MNTRVKELERFIERNMEKDVHLRVALQDFYGNKTFEELEQMIREEGGIHWVIMDSVLSAETVELITREVKKIAKQRRQGNET